MSQLKRLASQTAIYGVSSILGRLINYTLVPLHTAVFARAEMGIVTALYAYTAVFMIIYTLGMETAYFRFAKENPIKTYQSCSSVVILISSLVSTILIVYSDSIASIIGYPETGNYIIFIAIIMWIDALVAIPFARLRFENKAKKFALAKLVSIGLNILIQTSILWLIPEFLNLKDPSDSFSAPTIGFIFIANLVANSALLLILSKEIKDLRITLSYKDLKPYLIYAFPIFLMGLGGMLNEQLDKIILTHLLPDGFYNDMTSTEVLGVYGQTFKLAIFMMLAIQAFRYAGEPFFFSKSEDKEAPQLFAHVMHYFIISAILLLVLVSINVDLIAHIFLRKPEYRVALYLVPILLFGKLLYGIYINLSIWFKITDKTQYGTYFSLYGLVIIILGNIFLIPILGMLGSALSIVICYTLMCFICYYYGQKHFPIPYNFLKLSPYFIVGSALVYLSFTFHYPNEVLDWGIRIVISLLITALLWAYEKKKLKALKV